MANELSGLVELAGGSVDDLVLTPVESLHDAIAGRVFGALGPLGTPGRWAHDHVAHGAYRTVRRGARATTWAMSRSVRLLGGDQLTLLSRSRRGRSLLSGVNALVGDLLEERHNPLAIAMAVRHETRDVGCDEGALAKAFPRATGRVAVFVHGLAETEEDWWRHVPRRASFGARLRRDFGLTPVYVRYNTGLRIPDNGRRLSALLERLAGAWPDPVPEIVLVGHSMGGLVARSAVLAGRREQRAWAQRTRHLVTLGSPHTGVPLEQWVHTTAWALRALPESRALAQILDLRSAGIRDLRLGRVADDTAPAGKTPLEGCTQTFVGASLNRSLRHPSTWLGGDLLVYSDSATGRARDGTVAVAADHAIHVGPLSHFDLLDHPLVYGEIRRVIAEAAV